MKQIIFVVLAMVSAMFLTACGSGGVDGGNTSSSNQSVGISSVTSSNNNPIVTSAVASSSTGGFRITFDNGPKSTAKTVELTAGRNFLAELPKHVTKLNVTIFKVTGNTYYGSYTLNLVNGVSDQIGDMPIGDYTIGMECKNSNGNTLYYGNGSVTIVAGKTSEAVINLTVKDTITATFAVSGLSGNFLKLSDNALAFYKVDAIGISSMNKTDNVISSDVKGGFDAAGVLHFTATIRIFYTTQNDKLSFTISDRDAKIYQHEGAIDIYTILDNLDAGKETSLTYTKYVPSGGITVTAHFPTS